MAPTPQIEPDLDEWSRKIAATFDRAVLQRSNETELREDVDPVIRQAAQELYGLTAADITAERRVGSGRYDKSYGGLVVEWEWDMAGARRKNGAAQALQYLAAVRAEQGLDSAFTAVVADGRQWGFLATDLPDPQISLLDRAMEPDERFQWQPNSPAACRRFLVLLGSNRQGPVTPEGLANAFGPNSYSARRIVTLLTEALSGRNSDDRADTLYREWRRSVEVVYGDLDDDEGGLALALQETFDLGVQRGLGEVLFAVHTYFALVVRLVAIEVLGIAVEDEASQPTSWTGSDDDQLVGNLRAIDAGEVPNGLSIQNLFEGDVFSWYLDVLEGNVDLLNGVRETLDALSRFAMPRVAYGAHRAADLLRDLYRVLVPRQLRKALGEFPTPTWLAEAALERLRDLGADLDAGRVLDPTCGTGTFLLPVLRARVGRLRSIHGGAVPDEEVRRLLNDVVGMDINPVAVTAARANYVLALGDLATLGRITLPVWRADSILVPDEAPAQTTIDRPRLVGRPWRALRTSLPDPFPVPPALATAERMAELRRILEQALDEDDAEHGSAQFRADLRAAFAPTSDARIPLEDQRWEDVEEVAVELYDRIRELRDTNRNGVWARIIENNFAPVFAGRFDVVVGNPPWLTWTKTPKSWRHAGELIWKRYGLWRVPREGTRQRRAVASGDVAILVFALALHRYARSGGMVGMLVPRALVTADPGGRAFRQFRLRTADEDRTDVVAPVDLPFRVLEADDWSAVNPFSPDAANSPYFLAARPGETHRFPVPTRRWQRAEPGLRIGGEWAVVRSQVRQNPGVSNPVDRAVPNSAWSFQAEGVPSLLEGGSNRWRFGKGLDTRGANGVFFVRVIETNRPKNRVLIENIVSAGRNAHVRARRGWVETALVHPLLRGRDVQPWIASPSGHILAPYRPDDLGRLLEDDEFRSTYPEAWRWLRSHRAVLSRRKPPPTRNWRLSGRDWARLDGPMEHMGAGSIVVVRELQARPSAALIPATLDQSLGRTAMPLIDHKLVFCAVDSPDEAVYLATIINSSPIQDLLGSFSNAIAVSPQTLGRLPIPDFDLERHQDVVAAGREAVEAAGAGGDIDQGAIDAAVSPLLGSEVPSSRATTRVADEPVPGVA